MQTPEPRDLPLIVSLNGTLLQSDVLFESIFALLRKNFLYLLLLPYWLYKGMANLRRQVARRVDLDAERLPYHPEFLAYLRREAARKRKLILLTSANKKHARAVAEYLQIFKHVIASDGQVCRTADERLQSIVKAVGGNRFAYAGSSKRDLFLYGKADRVVLVNPSRKLKTTLLNQQAPVEKIFSSNSPRLRVQLKALRVHQWLKNLLVFVPAVAAHEIGIVHILQGCCAFFSYSFAASSIYLMNDLLDLAADRNHPYKKNRPLASGALPLHHGVLLIPVMLIASLALAMLLSTKFVGAVLLYLFMASLYSFSWKKKLMLDVILLAGLYVLRVIAGGIAVSIGVTFWMLLFSLFIFMSLALVKRTSELARIKNREKLEAGRAYRVEDLDYLSSMGTASGYLSVLVMALYINSQKVTSLYDHPKMLWFLCPILLFWISRLWLLVGRGEMHDDPLVFAVRDPVSWVIGGCSLVIMILAA